MYPVNEYPFDVKFLATSYVCVLVAVLPLIVLLAVLGLFELYVTVYVFAVQFAVYTLSPVVPFAILTLVCAVFPLLPVHPANVYPVFVGLTNENVAVFAS